MKPEATPWAAMIALAARFGVPPRAFWRLSLREWRALIGPVAPALGRDELQRLMTLYPDAPL